MAQPTDAQSHMYDRADKPMIADQQASVTAVSEAHALNASFSDTEVEAALDLLGVTINLLITRLEAHGFVADN